MRLDQMDGVGFVPDRRRRLSQLEKKILRDALVNLRAADAEEHEKNYIVDLAMVMPAGFLDRLDRAAIASQQMWPRSKKHPPESKPSPVELTGQHGTDEGLWSLLPSRLYRKITRHSGSPDEAMITATSHLLDFCEWCGDVFRQCTTNQWPDIPPLKLNIESTHYLVASQRFESQQDGDKWLAQAKETFNSGHFVASLDEIDRKIEVEEPHFRGPYLATRVEERFRGWLPCNGLPIENIRALIARMRGSGIRNPDRAIAKSLASLRDRGYVRLSGQFQSPETKWVFPAECILTGMGFLRATSLCKKHG